MEIKSEYNVEKSTSMLLSSFQKPGTFERLLPTKVRLYGEVIDSTVKAYRSRGGKQSYLYFEGQFSSRNGGSILSGRFFEKPPIFWSIFVNFLALLAAFSFFGPLFWWKGPDSIWPMAIGIVVALVAVVTYKVFIANIKAEAELLRQDLESIFREQSV